MCFKDLKFCIQDLILKNFQDFEKNFEKNV